MAQHKISEIILTGHKTSDSQKTICNESRQHTYIKFSCFLGQIWEHCNTRYEWTSFNWNWQPWKGEGSASVCGWGIYSQCCSGWRNLYATGMSGLAQTPNSLGTQQITAVILKLEYMQWGFTWVQLSHVMRKPVFALCEKQGRRSACTSAQADLHLCCSLPR